MSKFRIAGVLMALLVGIMALYPAEAGNRPGLDGYRFETAEYDLEKLSITTVDYDSFAELDRAANRFGVEREEAVVGTKYRPVQELGAFSLLRKFKDGRRECEIHMVKPMVAHQPQWLGHEFLHCKYGRWHK